MGSFHSGWTKVQSPPRAMVGRPLLCCADRWCRRAFSPTRTCGGVCCDPGPRQLQVVIGAVLPCEMVGLEDVELAVGQSRVQEALARVGRQIVLSYGLGQSVSLDGFE